MRRRSTKVRYVFFGAFFLFFVIALFTQVFVPVERFILNVANSVVFSNYQVLRGEAVTSTTTPSSSSIRVVSKRSDEFQDMFLINRSVEVGTKIVSGDSLVGIVAVQSSSTSKVQSITSPFFKIQGVISRSGIPLELMGRGASLLEARVPRGTDVQKGDVVYHDDGDALSLGVVSRIVDVVSDPFLILMISSSVNLTTLQEVEILTH